MLMLSPLLVPTCAVTLSAACVKRYSNSWPNLIGSRCELPLHDGFQQLLKSVVGPAFLGVTHLLTIGHELLSFTQAADGVTAQVRTSNGESISIGSRYLVGCDGGSSVVRKQLGFKMEGEPHLLEMRQALFHCPELYDKVRAPRARHYHRIDNHWTLMIVQDLRQHFTLHAVVDKDEDMAALFGKILGTPIKFEMVHCAKWVQRLLLAEHYQQDRVFLAGDAAHLVIPTGGLGMNTGVGDAIDLSWKLAATLRGWAGAQLLPSYEAERRPVGAINVKASGGGTAGRINGAPPIARTLTKTRPRPRRPGQSVEHRQGGSAEIVPRHRGRARLSLRRFAGHLRRAGGPPPNVEEYQPTSWPGARLPHVWLDPGKVSVHDLIGDGFTLLRLGESRGDAPALAKAFAGIGAPFSVLDINSDAARRTYGVGYLVVRPDLHVAWRGDALPDQPIKVALTLTGH